MVHEERRIRNALQNQHKLNAFSFETEEYYIHIHSTTCSHKEARKAAFFDVVATTAPLSSLLIITEVLQNATGWIFSHIGRSSRPVQPRVGFWAIGHSISVVQRQGRMAQIL